VWSQGSTQTAIDKYWLGTLKDTTVRRSSTPLEAARNGLRFYQQLQTADGHFAGEYGGPMFLMPGLVIVLYITKAELPSGYREEMIRYICNRASKVDGGWGIHIEGVSTVFGTALNYVALRLMGLDSNHPVCVKARLHLWKLGGATGIPSWGKFWLSILNVYSWEGNNSIPPELWLLPKFIPFYPGNMWCHSRQVYLPMGYLYGRRFQAPVDELIRSLRNVCWINSGTICARL
jgi:lanosterol synthase